MDKNKILKDLASLILDRKAEIINANQKDLANADGLDPTLVDRLKVDDKKVDGMIAAIQDVIRIDDPIGVILSEYQHPNGMRVRNEVVPFGRILIIYESRPDVTIEAAISAFKAGNIIYLKGGKEALYSNLYLVQLWHEVLEQNGASKDFIHYLNIPRDETQKLIKENPHRIDLIIPRGGEGLINYVRNNTEIPMLVSGRGNNFAYVHSDADFDMAQQIILNGKSRLSVCNALDKVLVNRHLPDLNNRISELIAALQALGITVHASDKVKEIAPNTTSIEDKAIYYEEFLSPDILIDLLENEREAIEWINEYSGGHSACIICEDKAVAKRFQGEVDCAAVLHNASTRFTDGGQFGFGAEIAISTQKLHFRGPVGLSQLVTNKWFVDGAGQVR